MIAVSRTLEDTRSMVHSRDATLFYDSNYRFFAKTRALWDATMDVQKFHKENEDSS